EQTQDGRRTNREQVSRLLDGEFDVVLRVPVRDYDGVAKSSCWGCNVLPRSDLNISRDSFTLVGKPIDDPASSSSPSGSSGSASTRHSGSPSHSPKLRSASPTPSELSSSAEAADMARSLLDVVVGAPSGPRSRIEDSLEAIDKLEEQLEEVGE